SPYQEAEAAVRAAPVKNTDESGWREKGQKRWLWTAATATVAFFVIHPRRGFEGLQSLLGETITGIVCSDRWAAYSKLPLNQRQICWAHTIRTQSTTPSASRCLLWPSPLLMTRSRLLIRARA